MGDDKVTRIPLDELMASQANLSKEIASAEEAEERLIRAAFRQFQLRLQEYDLRIEELESARDEHKLVIQSLVAQGAITEAQVGRIERTTEEQGRAITDLRELHKRDLDELNKVLDGVGDRLDRQGKQQGLLAELARDNHSYETK